MFKACIPVCCLGGFFYQYVVQRPQHLVVRFSLFYFSVITKCREGWGGYPQKFTSLTITTKIYIYILNIFNYL